MSFSIAIFNLTEFSAMTMSFANRYSIYILQVMKSVERCKVKTAVTE